MIDLEVMTIETAPEAAKADLHKVQQKYRFVPNLMGLLANSPPAIKAYLSLNELFDQTSLSPLERQIVLLATSVANGCEYCVAAHSAAAQMHQVPADVIAAIRDGRPLIVPRWEAVRALTEDIVAMQGWPNDEVVVQFFEAGYEPPQVLEVILGVTTKTLSNYANHVSATPLDPQFAAAAWSAPAAFVE
ncbi:MAG: carboxymuconolactone decarboxylase family protein [Pirellulales bacterium]